MRQPPSPRSRARARRAPCAGQKRTTEGVVTAIYPGTYNGFFIQTGGTGGAPDATPGASDAIFVYGGTGFDNAQGLAIGDSVEVTGAVSEFSGSTQITATSDRRAGHPARPR